MQPVFDLRLQLGNLAGEMSARFGTVSDALVTGLDAGVFELAHVDEPPQPLVQLRPMYPVFARMRGLEGHVELLFIVEPDGRTSDVRVTEAQPKGVFEMSASRAVEKWRFQPGSRNGQPVRVRVQQRVTFSLEE